MSKEENMGNKEKCKALVNEFLKKEIHLFGEKIGSPLRPQKPQMKGKSLSPDKKLVRAIISLPKGACICISVHEVISRLKSLLPLAC